MKKLFFGMLLMVFGLVSYTSPSFANGTTSKDVILFENEEITDENVLFERAKNNISDIVEDKNKISATITPSYSKYGLVSEPKSSIEIEPLITTQILKKVLKEDGTIVETLASTIMASYESSKNGYDPSISVSGYLTYYYDRYTTTGALANTFHDITSTTGRWSQLDSTVTLSERTVHYGAAGPRYPNLSYFQDSAIRNPISNTFSYTAPASWPPIQITHSVGVSSWVTLNRGGSTWKFQIDNRN